MPQKIFDFLLKIFNVIKYRIERFKKLGHRAKRKKVEKKILLKALGKKEFPRFSQFRYIFHFLNKKERNIFFVFLSLTLISVIGLVSLLYVDKTTAVPARGGEYIEGIVGYTRFINPLYSQSNEADQDIVELVYSGLTKRDARRNIVLDLAESYTLSEDEKTYTFKLKEALWHDGREFTSDDVVFTIKTIQNKEYNSPLRTSWKDIKVSPIDSHTVQFQLNSPSHSFLSLASLGILPQHIWEKVPPQNINLAEANNKPVGTGPYKFKSFVKDKVGAIKSYQFEIFDKFYGDKPYIKIISLKFYPDYVSAINALDNRQIDGLAFVPTEAKSALKLKGRLEESEIRLPQYNALFLNKARNSIFADKEIRMALAMAIDREKIIENALEGDGVLINGPILSGYFGISPSADFPAYDKGEAQKILVERGWVLTDGAQIRSKGSKDLKIEITTIEKNQNVKAAGIIKESWGQIGVEVEIKIVSASNIEKEVINNRNFEVFLFGQNYGSNLDPYEYWHSSAIRYPGFNLAGYSNRDADVLLEEARKTEDEVVKMKKYAEFEKIVSEDFPAIFLWQPTYTYLMDKKIKGVKMLYLLNPEERFTHLLSGYIKTKRTLK